MQRFPVTDPSHIAAARREAARMAATSGFDEADLGRLAIVVTELATNTLRHGGGGELLVGVDSAPGAGLQVIALDRGPGMANVADCFRDGYSTFGTPGNGLGAVQRQAAEVLVHSVPGRGTAVLARLRRRREPANGGERREGIISVAKPGEVVCGDAACIRLFGDGRVGVLVADGLGHGPVAAEAGQRAVQLFQQAWSDDPGVILRILHDGLRGTRGAAVCVALIDPAKKTMQSGGIGNISGMLIDSAGVRRMVSLAGIAGHNAGRIQTFSHDLRSRPVLVMYSDGLTSSWSPQAHAGLFHLDPVLIAAILYRDHVRGRDDATVVVWKG